MHRLVAHAGDLGVISASSRRDYTRRFNPLPRTPHEYVRARAQDRFRHMHRDLDKTRRKYAKKLQDLQNKMTKQQRDLRHSQIALADQRRQSAVLEKGWEMVLHNLSK